MFGMLESLNEFLIYLKAVKWNFMKREIYIWYFIENGLVVFVKNRVLLMCELVVIFIDIKR